MTIELTIVPAGIDVPPLGLEGPKGPEIRIDFEKLSLAYRLSSALLGALGGRRRLGGGPPRDPALRPG
jgi:hypothetical protein